MAALALENELAREKIASEKLRQELLETRVQREVIKLARERKQWRAEQTVEERLRDNGDKLPIL